MCVTKAQVQLHLGSSNGKKHIANNVNGLTSFLIQTGCCRYVLLQYVVSVCVCVLLYLHRWDEEMRMRNVHRGKNVF